MASAWDLSWGGAWGISWGSIDAVAAPRPIGGDDAPPRRVIRHDLEKKKYERLQAALKALKKAESSDARKDRKKAVEAVKALSDFDPYDRAPVVRPITATRYKDQSRQLRAAQTAVYEAIAQHEIRQKRKRQNNDAVLMLLMSI